MEILFKLIPPEYRLPAARVFFPIIVALGFIQIEGVIIYLANGATFIELVIVFIGATLYRGWYVHIWAKLERWLLVNDRVFLFRFKFLRLRIGHGIYRILRWTRRLTNRRDPSLMYSAVLLGLGFFFGLTGVGLKFGIGMIVVSHRPLLIKAAVNLGLMANTYIFLHWGPEWLRIVWHWLVTVFRG